MPSSALDSPMAGATEKVVILDDTIEEIELDPVEMEELDRLAEETLWTAPLISQ